MARIGISITKSVAFRNSVQEFSNVYYYEDALGSLPSAAGANTLIDEVTAFEKGIHGTACTFVRGRLWSETGSKATSEMISQKTLSGAGTLTSNSSMDRERTYLFRIRAGLDSRGNPVYLRKWFHTCADLPGAATSVSILANTAGFSQAQRDAAAALVATMGAIGGGTEPWKICSSKGRFPTAGQSWVCHPFLEHHQLGDQWRDQ